MGPANAKAEPKIARRDVALLKAQLLRTMTSKALMVVTTSSSIYSVSFPTVLLIMAAMTVASPDRSPFRPSHLIGRKTAKLAQ